MTRTFIAPNRYVQGKDEIKNLGKYIETFGKKAFIIGSTGDLERTENLITKGIENNEVEVYYAHFNEASTKQEFYKLRDLALSQNSDVIIGLGGGKSLDCAKAVAYYTDLPVIIIPTIASTDGPCSSIVALYKETGEFDSYLPLKNNPNLILVDSSIISQAPTRFLVAGMGDALSTYFEARTYIKNNPNTTTKLSLATAKLCYETLLSDSVEAIKISNENQVNEALENIIEANILLSCLGFENTGLSLAHSVHNVLTLFPETSKFMHGEKVAFGVIVQLAVEQSPELNEVIDYCKLVGLPTNLRDLGLNNIDDSKLMSFSKTLVKEKQVINTIPWVKVQDIYSILNKLK